MTGIDTTYHATPKVLITAVKNEQHGIFKSVFLHGDIKYVASAISMHPNHRLDRHVKVFGKLQQVYCVITEWVNT